MDLHTPFLGYLTLEQIDLIAKTGKELEKISERIEKTRSRFTKKKVSQDDFNQAILDLHLEVQEIAFRLSLICSLLGKK